VIRKIAGNLKKDNRGTVRFVNKFNFDGVKRFYQVENANTKITRAFHGHMKEAKYVYVVSGSIMLCAVYLDSVTKPNPNNKVEKVFLSADRPQIVYIPPAYANGFKALQENTKVIFFSTSTLDESIKDDYRFDHNYWGEDIWSD